VVAKCLVNGDRIVDRRGTRPGVRAWRSGGH
jgi:hypothetical protein